MSADMSASPGKRQDERIRNVSLFQRALTRPELGSVCGLVLIIIAFVVMTSSAGTFTAMFGNLIGVQAWVELAAYVGILAIAASLLMISGEFDLSLGANIALAGHSFAIFVLFGLPIPLAILLTFIELALLGALIGFIVVRTGLPSFIVTLGFWFASRGAAVFAAQTFFNQSRLSIRPYVDPPAGGGEDPTWIDNVFAFDRAFGLPFDAYVYYFILIAVVATFVLQRTRYGNWIFASGGDPVAARAVGVPVERVKISLFIFSASCACLLGVVTVMASGSADPQAGDFRELHAIAAAVIGGCALTGGYGSALGAVFGAFIFAIASRGINFVPFIDNNLFRVMLGLLILGAALLNQALRNRVVKG